MIYREHIPLFPLNQWVEKIWYCNADRLDTSALTIPFLHQELIFNFSEKYILRKTGNNYEIKNPRSFISGLHRQAYFSESSGQHQMLGVLFKINGLSAFTGFNTHEFTDHFTDASLVFGSIMEALCDKIQTAKTADQKITRIEKFLFQNMEHKGTPVYLNAALRFLQDSKHKGSVKAACKKISISNKSLINAFHKHIGLNPLKYSQLYQLNLALHSLHADPSQSLTELAYRHQFFDQSHFTSLFKSFSSLSPSKFAAHVRDQKVDKQSPNFIF